MEYRIKRKSRRYNDKVITEYYIQRKYKFLIFYIWDAANSYCYDSQEEAEGGIRYKCKCDAVVVPKDEIVKHMNCNE